MQLLILATPLHGRDKDELDGEDVRQHNKVTRFRQLAFLMVVVLLFVSISTTIFALNQSRSARQSQKQSKKKTQFRRSSGERKLKTI